jgi:hypothetical protein
MSNKTKAEHINAARERLERAAREESAVLRLVQALPDGLSYYLAAWRGPGLAVYGDAYIVVELASFETILPIMAMLPPAGSTRVKEGKGWAASVIPSDRVGLWLSKHKDPEAIEEVAPLFMKASPTPEPSTQADFHYYARVGDVVVDVDMRIHDPDVFRSHTTDRRFVQGEIVSCHHHWTFPFQKARCEKYASGTPGVSGFTLTWPLGTYASDLVDEVEEAKRRKAPV